MCWTNWPAEWWPVCCCCRRKSSDVRRCCDWSIRSRIRLYCDFRKKVTFGRTKGRASAKSVGTFPSSNCYCALLLTIGCLPPRRHRTRRPSLLPLTFYWRFIVFIPLPFNVKFNDERDSDILGAVSGSFGAEMWVVLGGDAGGGGGGGRGVLVMQNVSLFDILFLLLAPFWLMLAVVVARTTTPESADGVVDVHHHSIRYLNSGTRLSFFLSSQSAI